MEYIVHIALTYAAGIAVGGGIIASHIHKYNKAEKLRIKRKKEYEEEISRVGKRVCREMMRDEALNSEIIIKKGGKDSNEKKAQKILSVGIACAEIAAAWEKKGAIIVGSEGFRNIEE